eukprot:maker-scaffold86_size395752-snap-gene-2.32 protein:Tk10885 transcript:maker-scaffold86_size395752-snap-gene-2.32-mRNA-1 annotation:"PREDICTED: uncharacterized protein LOC100905950"
MDIVDGATFMSAACFRKDLRGFPNDPCVSQDNKNGTCYTTDECTTLRGKASGSCAQGYGTCCTFSLGCGQTSSENTTYFESTAGTAGDCMATICPAGLNICQIRLDFNQFQITGPSTSAVTIANQLHGMVNLPGATQGVTYASQCLTDTFSVMGGTNPSPPTICGTNKDQHMYVNVDGNACIKLMMSLGTTAVGTSMVQRRWSMKVLLWAMWASSSARGQSLCDPNPCGENTLCLAQGLNVISCKCLPGFVQIDDDSDGCAKRADTRDRFNQPRISNVVKKDESRFGTKDNRPQLEPGLDRLPDRESPLVIGFDDSGKAVSGSDLVKTNQVEGNIIRESELDLSDVNSPLSESETALDVTFKPEFSRNPFKRPGNPEKPQTPAEVQRLFPEVCGRESLCKVQLNRPVCYCAEGYQGNPYQVCSKTPSRVGLRFRRQIFA